MLEIQMEEAIAACPDLFIEPGLTLLRRQVVINGRRPDVLFSDGLERHLLVEIQSGRLTKTISSVIFTIISITAPSTHQLIRG